MNKRIIGRVALCIIGLLLNAAVMSQSIQPANIWATQFSNNTTDICHSATVAVDNNGFIYTAGYFNGIVDFDPGPGVFNLVTNDSSHIFVCKQTAAGSLVWAKDYGKGAARAITIDFAGAPIVTGYFTDSADFDPDPQLEHIVEGEGKEIFVMKLTTNGNLQWVNTYHGKLEDIGQSVVSGNDGLIYVTGSFEQQVDFDPTGPSYNPLHTTGTYAKDIFVLKLSPNGGFEWAVNMGGDGNDQGNTITLDSNNLLVVGGYFSSTADFDPTPLGNQYLSSYGDLDIFVMKIKESNGTLAWARGWGSSREDMANALICDNNDNICVTGSFSQTVNFGSTTLTAGVVDAFVLKIDENGNDVWAKRLGGTRYDVGYGISVDLIGNVFTTGGYEGEADFDPSTTSNYYLASLGGRDAFISKLSPNGNFVWAVRFAGALFEQGYDISTPSAGYIYSTGDFGDAVDFDPSPTATAFMYRGNMYVSKLRDTTSCPPVVAGFRAANFNASAQVNICKGNSIVFLNQSTGNPVTWNWSFQGGTPSSSNLQNPPSIVYWTAGIYPVSLTVSNACGSTNTKTIVGYVNVADKPVANFSASICGGVVNFLDLSTGNPLSWNWIFPGGNPATSNLQNPVVTFLPNHNYPVSLTVTNSCGSATQTNVVHLQ